MFTGAGKITEPAAPGTGVATEGCHLCLRSGYAYYSKHMFGVFEHDYWKEDYLVTKQEGICCKNSGQQADCTIPLTGGNPGTLRDGWSGFPQLWTGTNSVQMAIAACP